MDKTQYYKAFVAQGPEEVLCAVLKNKEDVLLAISLINGAYIEGIVLDITTDSNQSKSVCMLSQNKEISYFNIHNIAVLTIKQPEKMVVELSRGASDRSMLCTSDNLTVLQLKIWLRNERYLLGEHIQNFNIDHLSLSELNDRLNIQFLFASLKKTIDLIKKDALVKEAWQEVETIVLKRADTLKIKIQNGVLTISMAVNKALPENISNTLEEKILQVL